VPSCFFVTDLHGQVDRYTRLFDVVKRERPAAVFVGGDILPSGFGLATAATHPFDNFIRDFLSPGLEELRRRLGKAYPRVFVIMGNDDPRIWEDDVRRMEAASLISYAHEARFEFGEYVVFGYACVPPSPFLLKDWERYDVSRGVDPGCISPEEGHHTVPVPPGILRYSTIKDDLDRLTGKESLDNAIILLHTPPYDCSLDRAALDGRAVDHAPLDVHVGSIAVQRLIAERQPLITLHGHVHESSRLTGTWKEQFGRTWCYNAAHDGPGLCLVRFDPSQPGLADRELL